MLLRSVLRVFVLALTLSQQVSANGICPDKPAATDVCTQVNYWNDLKTTIASSNGVVVLCPFDITKTDPDPILIDKGVTVMCRKASDNDECTIRGAGEHIRSISHGEVVIVGLTFTESDEHAVYIQSGIPESVHTFCDCTFEK